MWNLKNSLKNQGFSLGRWSILALMIVALAACKPGEDKKKEDKDKCKGLKEVNLSELKKKDREEFERIVKKLKEECSGEDDGVGSGGNPGAYTFPELPGRVCTIDRFTQTGGGEQKIKKVDILFVMDNSGSMKDDWGRLASNMSHMVRELPSDTDIRYAVLLAHVGTWSGKLYAPAGLSPVLDNQKLDVNRISNNLHKIFTEGMKVSDKTGEANFFSLYHAVTTHARDNQRLGFFRPDAALSVIHMSDEQETGFPFPNPQAPGLPPRCDAAYEDAIKRDYYDKTGVNLKVTANAVRALKGDMPIRSHAFVNITKEDLFKRNSKNASCLHDSLGYGFFEMTKEFNGLLFSIQENRAEGMARCGQVIRESLEQVRDFQLSKPANLVDPATIMAAVDAELKEHQYNSSSNMVHLNDAGNVGSLIQIRHCEPDQRPTWNLTDFMGDAGQRAVALSWKTNEYATRGKVLYGTSSADLAEVQGAASPVTSHVVTVNNLNPNTSYYFQAVSWDEYGQEKRSAVINLRTKPDWTVGGFTGQPSKTSLVVKWRTPEYVTKGKVAWGSAASNLNNVTPEETTASHDHEVVINGLQPDTTYYVQAISRDEFGLEKKSAVEPVKTLLEWSVVGLNAVASRNSVALTFKTPELATNGKIVFGLSATALNSQVSTGNTTEHAVTVTGLNANTNYYFQAVATDHYGVEKRSDVIGVRTLIDWNITNLATSSTETTLTVGWETLEYATTGKLIWGTSETSLNTIATSGAVGNAHSITLSGLTPDTIYYVQAVSSDEFGLEKRSAVTAVRTQPRIIVPPPVPVWTMTDFNGVAERTSIMISWKTAEYPTVGKILWGTSETSLNNEISETTAVRDHVLTATGLTPDTLYYFQAVSVDDHNQEQRSAIVAVRTLEDVVVPPPVLNWVVKGFDATTTPTSADVIWQTPGAPTRATLKVGLSATDLTLQSIPVNDPAETHLVPVTGLTPNTDYYLQVIAVDANGRTVESVIIKKRTKAQ